MTDPMSTAEVRQTWVAGLELRVATWRLGDPSDHLPMLFFNGIGTNIEAVASLAQAFDDRAFIIFDMPGIGGSAAAVLPYNPFTICHATAELLDRLGTERVDVMGMSWGGAIAQHFALQHGDRVRRLVLCATTAGALMIPGDPAALAKMTDPRRYLEAAFSDGHFGDYYDDAFGKVGGKRHRGGPAIPPTRQGYFYQLLALTGWTSAPALPFLDKPVLILMGGRDRIVPALNGSILHALLPHSELEVFEDGGHLFLLSHGARATSSIRRFLDRARPEQMRAAA